jgi:hypothetical protein
MDEWRQRFLDASPMFEPLRGVGSALAELERWPTLDDYNVLLHPPIPTASGAEIGFVPQAGKPAHMEDKYESRIYLAGEVQTRTENWHDLFNALVWLAFPRTKAAINARHFASITESRGEGNRDKTQDALTLFDESGVVVLYSDGDLASLLQDHQWQELFWARRQSVNACMKFVIFGHSLYEKALKPYIGITGKGLLIKVEDAFFSQTPETQLEIADGLMAAFFSGKGQISSRDLSPVPLLGVPGWWPENVDALFYLNTRYFRPPGGRDVLTL